MPYLTLTLNGYPVDLPADAAVALSYRANDLRNLDSRETAFSETFTLPLTAVNSAALGQPHSLDSLTDAPYQLLPAVLTSPGGAVLLDGFAILESTGDGMEVTLTNALGSLFAQVGDKALRDLDLSAYDHSYGFDAVLDAQWRMYTDGYAYAIADNGRLAGRAPAFGLLYHELLLSTYYHTILTAIVAEALPGYRVRGSLLAETVYQEATLPQASGNLQLAESVRRALSAQGRTDTPRTYVAAPGGSSTPAIVPLVFPVGANNPFFAGTTYNLPAYPLDVTIKLRVQVRLAANASGSLVSIARLIVRDLTQTQALSNAGELATHDILIGFPSNVPTTVQTVDMSVELPAVSPNAQLQIQLSYIGLNVTILPNSSVEWTAGPRVYPGAPVSLAANLPDISQADFLKLACNQFNLIIQADSIYKIVRFDLFNDLERNRNQAVDWTSRIDYTSRPRLTYRLGEYAQHNSLAYDSAPEAYKELYAPADMLAGSADLPVRNATLAAHAEAFVAPVVLPLPRAMMGIGALWLPYFEPEPEGRALELYDYQKTYRIDNTGLVLYGGVRWKVKILAPTSIVPGNPPTTGEVPIQFATGGPAAYAVAWEVAPDEVAEQELATAARVVESTTNLVVREDDPGIRAFNASRILSRNGLDFAALLPAYYRGLRSLLERVQLLAVDLRLTALDIVNLDFTKPVKIGPVDVPGYGRLDTLSYLNNIDQYMPGLPGAVEVQLLALGLPVPGLAPPVLPPVVVPRRAFVTEDAQYCLLSEAGEYILEEY